VKKAIQGVAVCLFAVALVWGGCASKKGGTAVLVVSDPEAVRGCAFLGRVNQTATESEATGIGVLRQRTAEMGGNTLLLRAAGTGEAWNCSGAFSAYSPPTEPSPTRSIPGLIPTAAATPRY
jgi:hypothetical protein